MAIEDLLHGEGALEAMKAGCLKALAVTLTAQSPSLPGVPTMAETVPGFESHGWIAFWMPAGTPADVVRKYQGGLDKVMSQPDVSASATN